MRPIPRPVVRFPLTKSFNVAIATELKEWSYNKKFGYRRLIKKKNTILLVLSKTYFNIKKHWPSFMYRQEKIVDNGGEVCNKEVKKYVEMSIL